MDFLRQLAPALETNAARAVAVLPSRFSNPHPLQGVHDHTQPVRRLFDDGALLAPQAGLPSVTDPETVARRHVAAAPIAPGQTSPASLASLATQMRRHEKVIAPATAREKAAVAPAAASSRALQNRPTDNAERLRPPSPQGTTPAAALLTATPAPQKASAPPALAQQAWPLSDASLAQRISKPQDEGPVVHVTIGRIEVVAHTAPAQAPPRSPAPRQPSVTLADYLRGSPGGRP